MVKDQSAGVIGVGYFAEISAGVRPFIEPVAASQLVAITPSVDSSTKNERTRSLVFVPEPAVEFVIMRTILRKAARPVKMTELRKYSRFRMENDENVKFCKPKGFTISIKPTKIGPRSSYSGMWHLACL